jgi:LuxR family maltose regulon positive regulatory protein
MVPAGLSDFAYPDAEAKLQPPLRRPGLVERSALLARLALVHDDIPLVLLTAPAGYGKTTVLSQASAADGRDVAWVTVEQADGDPVRFASHVALVLHRIEPLDPAVFEALATGDGPPHVAALPLLLRSLQRWERPALLVLDDVDRLRSVPTMSFLRALIDRLPPGFRVLIGSRLGLSLGRLRSEGRCAEFGPGDLALSAEEVRDVLAGEGLVPTEEMARAVVRRTEGWPAGVYLAALALRASPVAADAAGRIAGDDPFIAYYFQELLARESPDTVRFLLRCAPLDEMCASLCDHVLGRTGSAAQLTEAARRNLFVVPLDRRGEWYRFHHLFAEFLLSELRRREPGEESQVHRTAASWYEEHLLPEHAIRHALAGRDIGAAARLVNRYAREFWAAGRLHTVREWLDSLDDEGLTSYPPLAITAAWISAFQGDPLSAQRFLDAADRGSFAGHLPDGSASLTSATTVLRAVMGALGVDRMLVDAEAAVDLEPPGAPWHPAAIGCLGVAHVLAGDNGLAVKELQLAAERGREAQRPTASAALAELSLLAAGRGDWPRAEDLAQQALDLVAAAGIEQHVFTILSHTAAARVAAHRGDEARARRQVAAALRLYATPSPAAFPWMSAQVTINLGHVFLDLGDLAAARFRAREARSHLSRLPTEGVLRHQLSGLSVRLTAAGGDLPATSAMALSAAEMRVLQLLPTHLTLAEISEELHTSRHTVKTQVAAVYRKLQCSTRTDAVRRGRERGLVRGGRGSDGPDSADLM